MKLKDHQLRALGGVGGPAAFIAAWLLLGATRPGYSPVNDPISRLAAVGASSRVPMTGGFLAFGLGVSLYGAELRAAMPGGSGVAAMTTAVASVGIAASPLGSTFGDGPHAAFAGLAYLSLASAPILGGRYLAGHGRRGAAAASVAIGIASGASLLASTLVSRQVGLFQRLGLSLGDAWIVATALWLFSRAGDTQRAGTAGHEAAEQSQAHVVVGTGVDRV